MNWKRTAEEKDNIIADLRAQLAQTERAYNIVIEQCRELVNAQLAAKGQGEPVATVIKNGSERQWMSENLGSLPDGLYSLYLAAPASAQPADLKEALVELTATQRKLIDANAEIAALLLMRESAAEAVGWAECGCRACNVGRVLENGWPVIGSRMILCPTCGNKRCPHASDHTLACTGSNEPGQPGSAYGVAAPSPAAQPVAKDEQAERAAIERRAKEIYATFAFADRYPWVEGGNSTRQDDARAQARAELSQGQNSASNGATGEKA
jgi:hypothetical protein